MHWVGTVRNPLGIMKENPPGMLSLVLFYTRGGGIERQGVVPPTFYRL